MEETTTPTGRALDLLVAEKVMGFRRWYFKRDNSYLLATEKAVHDMWTPIAWKEGIISAEVPETAEPYGDGYNSVPLYSSDIAAAWKVVERLTECVGILNAEVDDVAANLNIVGHLNGELAQIATATAPTFPVAVCHLALCAWEAGMDFNDSPAA